MAGEILKQNKTSKSGININIDIEVWSKDVNNYSISGTKSKFYQNSELIGTLEFLKRNKTSRLGIRET